MQIHQVEETQVPHYVMDPDRGQVLRTETVVRATSTTTIAYNDQQYGVGEDGTFDVPADIGEILVRTPGWKEGPNPFPPEENPALHPAGDNQGDAPAKAAASHRSAPSTRR
jgi:hypothetical protein